MTGFPLDASAGVVAVGILMGLTVGGQLAKVMLKKNPPPSPPSPTPPTTDGEDRSAEEADASKTDGSSSSKKAKNQKKQPQTKKTETIPEPTFGKATVLLKVLLSLIRPVTVCAAVVGVLRSPEMFQKCGAFPALLSNYAATSIAKALPAIYVNELSEAYAYGSLAQRALTAMATNVSAANATALPEAAVQFLANWASNSTAIPTATRDYINGLLAEASTIAGGRTVSLAELLKVYALIKEQEAHVSLTSRILGIFSFVNIIYAISIVGMVALAIPVLTVLAKKCGPWLMHIVAPILAFGKRTALTLWYKVLVPLYVHTKFVHEWIPYYLVLYAFVESSRYAAVADAHSMGGTMMAFTGIVLYFAGCSYTMALRQSDFKPLWMRPAFDLTSTMWLCAAAIISGCGAIMHQSSFLGYLAVMNMLAVSGFYAVSCPLCTIIGFKDESSLIRCAQGALCVLSCFVLARANGAYLDPKATRLLRPFESAVSVLGSAAYMLAVDIAVGLHYNKPRAHALFIASALGMTAAGSIFGMTGLTSTALVFSYMYVGVTYATLLRPKNDLWIVWVFGGCVGMYLLSYRLSADPGMLIGAFTNGVGRP